MPISPVYVCAESEDGLWFGLKSAGLGHLTPPELDVLGTLYEATGIVLMDEKDQRYPHFRALRGYYAAIHRHLTESQRAALPIVPKPKHVIRICA